MAASKYASKYYRSVSSIPEEATLQCRFDFVMIGPNAHAVVEKMTKADVNLDISEMMRVPEEAERRASTPSLLSTSAMGIFVLLDEAEALVAKVHFHTIENFSQSLPKLINDNSVRETCFVLLIDKRCDINADVLPLRQSSFAEMNFNYNMIEGKSKSGHRSAPALHAVILYHEMPTRVETITEDLDQPSLSSVDSEPQALKHLVEKLQDFTRDGPLKQFRREVDFDRGNELYDCIQDLAKDMYFPEAGRFPRFASEERPKRRSSCCAVQ